VDLKAECDQLNLAHKTKTNKQTPCAHLVQYRFKIRDPFIIRLWSGLYRLNLSECANNAFRASSLVCYFS